MKFTSDRYPQLHVKVPGGSTVRFVDGQADVTDKAAIEAVKALPDQYGVKAVGSRPAKQDKSE